MSSTSRLRAAAMLLAMPLIALAAHAQTPTYSVSLPGKILAGTLATVTISVLDTSTNIMTAYPGSATMAVTGVAISNPPGSIAFPKTGPATASIQIMFTGTGTATFTVTDSTTPAPAANDKVSTSVSSTTVSSVQSICAECYASIGIGTDLSFVQATDYSNNSNILSSNQVGSSTPEYIFGVSFQMSIHGVRYHYLNCHPSDYAAANPVSTYCYPIKAFVNLNFSTATNQTLSGYTFGLSHSLTSHLDLMAGFVYGAYSQPSPGFQAAAIQTVKAQQAANNPYYAQFNLANIQNGSKNAFDGFPTQMISAAGVSGSAIYSGNILTTTYHPGIFLGINIPVSLGSLFSGTNGGK
jgi:hypothetical protein